MRRALLVSLLGQSALPAAAQAERTADEACLTFDGPVTVRRVAPGETAAKISRRTGIDLALLRKANCLVEGQALVAGDVVVLPGGGDPAAALAAFDTEDRADPEAAAGQADPGRATAADDAAAELSAFAFAPGADGEGAGDLEGAAAELGAFGGSPPEAPAADSTPAWRLGGVVTARTAYAFGPRELQLIELLFEPYAERPLGENWSVHLSGRLRLETEDELDPGRPAQRTRSVPDRRYFFGDAGEVELRDAYVQGEAFGLALTIGKQQVVWGQADQLRVLDVVNPVSFREFVLEDFEDARIPIWGVRAERVRGNVTLEGVLLIDNTHNDLAPSGSSFELTSSRFVPISPQILGALDLPLPFGDAGRTLGDVIVVEPIGNGPVDVEFGGRVKAFVGGWDLSAVYLHHTEDSPTLDITATDRGVRVVPVYDEVDLLGVTFANAFGSLTVRGEVGYTTDRKYAPAFSLFSEDAGREFFGLLPEALPMDVVPPEDAVSFDAEALDRALSAGYEADNLSYVLGLDWFGLDRTLVSVQAFHDIILADDRDVVVSSDIVGLGNEEIVRLPREFARPIDDVTISLLVRRTALSEKLVLQGSLAQNLVDDDGLFRLLLTYAATDQFSLFGTADVFYGDADGIFGQFEDASRLGFGAVFAF